MTKEQITEQLNTFFQQCDQAVYLEQYKACRALINRRGRTAVNAQYLRTAAEIKQAFQDDVYALLDIDMNFKVLLGDYYTQQMSNSTLFNNRRQPITKLVQELYDYFIPCDVCGGYGYTIGFLGSQQFTYDCECCNN